MIQATKVNPVGYKLEEVHQLLRGVAHQRIPDPSPHRRSNTAVPSQTQPMPSHANTANIQGRFAEFFATVRFGSMTMTCLSQPTEQMQVTCTADTIPYRWRALKEGTCIQHICQHTNFSSSGLCLRGFHGACARARGTSSRGPAPGRPGGSAPRCWPAAQPLHGPDPRQGQQ